MNALPHRYEVRITGAAVGHAMLSSGGVPDLRSAPPVEFDGPGDAWSPEQLLLAAVQSCFFLTFRAIAQASRIGFTSLAHAVRAGHAAARALPRQDADADV